MRSGFHVWSRSRPGSIPPFGSVLSILLLPYGLYLVLFPQAVGANPLPLVIPCHRVLAAHDRIGGFGCGLAVKRFLLRLEGITWTEASPG